MSPFTGWFCRVDFYTVSAFVATATWLLRLAMSWHHDRRIFHDFRRTAMRNLENAGVPHSQAMKLVGHKIEAIYNRYAISNENDLREAVRKLDAALNGG